MVGIACLGMQEFVMGFRLAGIRKIFEVDQNREMSETAKKSVSEHELRNSKEFLVSQKLHAISETQEPSVFSQMVLDNVLKTALEDKSIGILVIDQKVMDSLSDDMKEDLFDRIQPTTVAVSTKDEQEDLRRMIKRSVGVDVWEK